MISVTIQVVVDNVTIEFQEELEFRTISPVPERKVEQAQQLFTKGLTRVDKALESLK